MRYFCLQVVDWWGVAMTIDVFITVVLVIPFALFGWYIANGRLRRRRATRTIYVPNSPGTEIEQRYGAYDANAYDADTGSTRLHREKPGGDRGETWKF